MPMALDMRVPCWLCVAVACLAPVCLAGFRNDNLELALIVPKDVSRLFSIPKVTPAIEYAVDTVLSRNLLRIPREKIVIRSADSGCDSVHGPIAAIDMHYRDSVNVFFGPVCDYSLAPVARYAPFWDVPIISPGGMAHDFGVDKKDPNAEFPNLTRVGWTFDSLALYLEAAIIQFQWSKIKIVYDSHGHGEIFDSFCWLAMTAFVRHLRTESPLEYHLYNFVNMRGYEEYVKILQEEIAAKYSGE